MDLDRSGSDGRSFTLSHRHTYGTTSTGSFPELSVVVLIVVNCLSLTGLPSWTDLAILGRSESITRRCCGRGYHVYAPNLYLSSNIVKF